MTTRKATKKAKTLKPFISDITTELHKDYGLRLEIHTTIVGRDVDHAAYLIDGDSKTLICTKPDRMDAETTLRDAAMNTIEEIQIHRTLVEMEAAAGVPEAIQEINETRATRRVITLIPCTDQFGLYLAGNPEPLLARGSYLEVEHAAKEFFGETPLPF
ncbi:hypothetical protein [Herpetosiphon geysericola]|uniref:Uncharacterized protein n=1 Tax=Herpetosiphon geysericola TaxID=70996 RepID=A0A0N8GP88_9CHLR|nr:hypothetical protein [Herpetosiphon geysericola]KPL80218.1 hypothetical protein SE18_24490 [Herpetosiphon geysericola]